MLISSTSGSSRTADGRWTVFVLIAVCAAVLSTTITARPSHAAGLVSLGNAFVAPDNSCNSGSASSNSSGVNAQNWGITPNHNNITHGGLPCGNAYFTFPNGSTTFSWWTWTSTAPATTELVDVAYLVPCWDADYPRVQWYAAHNTTNPRGAPEEQGTIDEAPICYPTVKDLGFFDAVGNQLFTFEITDLGPTNPPCPSGESCVGNYIGAGDVRLSYYRPA